MGFFDPVVTISKPTWRRLEMLVAEIAYLNGGTKLDGWTIEAEAEALVRGIVDQYVSDYFEESTHSVVQLITRNDVATPPPASPPPRRRVRLPR